MEACWLNACNASVCLQSTDYIYGAKRAFHNEIGRFIEQGGFSHFFKLLASEFTDFFCAQAHQTRPDSIHTYHLDVDKNKCMQVHLKHFRFYIFWRGNYNLVRRRRKFMK